MVLIFLSATIDFDSKTSLMAEVGQACAQAPQLTQSESKNELSKLFTI